MLYNPNWNPLESSTLQDLVNWLETMPADGTYSYFDSENCLLCNYLKSRGIPNPIVNKLCWYEFSGSLRPYELPEHFNRVSEGSLFSNPNKRHTYGAALKRAKAISK
jgi:hypothetical protein